MTIKKFKKAMREGERGNVLFLILIAVALFAALSYAVTQSTRSGGGDAGRETSKISSAQMTQYPAGIRTSLVRMIIGGQNVDKLEFNAPDEFTNCTEYPASSGKYPRCVFHPTGGGATYDEPSSDLIAGVPGRWYFNAENQINLVGTSTAVDLPTVATADLIAFLPNVAQGVCQSINEELGISTTVGDITETGILFSSAGGATGNMINDGAEPDICNGGCDGATIGNDVPALDGQPFGCFYHADVDGAGNAGYVYYHVLIER